MKSEPVINEAVRLLFDTRNVSCSETEQQEEEDDEEVEEEEEEEEEEEDEIEDCSASCNRWMTSDTSEPIVAPSYFNSCLRAGGSGGEESRVSAGSYSHGPSGSGSLNFLKWTEHLDVLLNDPTGLDLFQEYLKQEDHQRYHMLKFWLACRGLHKQPKDRITDCIKVIHSKLFLKISHGINSRVSKSVAQQILAAGKHKIPPSTSVFDEASKIVYDVMKTVLYPNFLSSEMYFNYAQKMQVEFCNSEYKRQKTTVFTEDELPRTDIQPLAMVEEDKELNFDTLSMGKAESLRRILIHHSSSCNRVKMNSNHKLYYSSYNPVSIQSSEWQSLSSGRTDSQTDLTHLAEDLKSVDDTGREYIAQRQRHKRHSKKAEYDLDMSKIIINDMVNMPKIEPIKPRTFNADIPNKIRAIEPSEFFHKLASKLEVVKTEIENGNLVRSKINSIDYCEDGPRAMLQFFDSNFKRMYDDDQDILDEHVKRVWKDKTPGRSPSIGTPVLPKSPPSRRASSIYSCSSVKQYYPSSCSSRTSHMYPGYGSTGRRRDRGARSSFSVDSGNGTDPAEYSDCIPKSLNKHNYAPVSSGSEFSHSSHHPSYTNRSWVGSQRTITDSGVSVISNSLNNSATGGASSIYRDRMISWQQEKKWSQSAKYSKSVSSGFDNKDDCSTVSKKKTKSVIGSNKLKGVTVMNSKDLSQPWQPFLADPNMPPLPFHKINARDTLEETYRRLQEMSRIQETPLSKTENEGNCHTSVVYSFSDENVPYMLKVPRNPITLRMFKDYMPPKNGNFRYFFVTACEDFENKPVYEEINDDDCILPIWKGKVMSQIKNIK